MDALSKKVSRYIIPVLLHIERYLSRDDVGKVSMATSVYHSTRILARKPSQRRSIHSYCKLHYRNQIQSEVLVNLL